jgi:hypothetical protein
MSNSTDGFYRSTINAGALVNVQDENLIAYKKQRKHVNKMINDSDKINKLETELGNIKEDMLVIKQLLLKVLNK